ncbi:MAG: hypothetical protein AAFZ80_01890 [Cyanobacteria bacterium P01_A01_bin.105]
MRSHPKTFRIVLYFLIGLTLCLATVGLKVIATWATETYLYSVPVLGGLFASLELIEISSIILVALLAVCLGALTLYLPTTWPLVGKWVLLAFTLPLVIASGYVTRQTLWVQRVSIGSNISPIQAQEVTNTFLRQQTGEEGGWAYYRYTAENPQPPTEFSNISTLSADDMAALQAQLSEASGLEVGLFNTLFSLVGWLIRLVYAALTGLMAVIYFFKGKQWADRHPAYRHPS